MKSKEIVSKDGKQGKLLMFDDVEEYNAYQKVLKGILIDEATMVNN